MSPRYLPTRRLQLRLGMPALYPPRYDRVGQVPHHEPVSGHQERLTTCAARCWEYETGQWRGIFCGA